MAAGRPPTWQHQAWNLRDGVSFSTALGQAQQTGADRVPASTAAATLPTESRLLAPGQSVTGLHLPGSQSLSTVQKMRECADSLCAQLCSFLLLESSYTGCPELTRWPLGTQAPVPEQPGARAAGSSWHRAGRPCQDRADAKPVAAT